MGLEVEGVTFSIGRPCETGDKCEPQRGWGFGEAGKAAADLLHAAALGCPRVVMIVRIHHAVGPKTAIPYTTDFHDQW
jgi:hypothetical protein